MLVSVCFTNFGPYHLARLRRWRRGWPSSGDRLIAYEVAGTERTYPWTRSRRDEPFEWVTLFPDRVLETIAADDVPLGDDRGAGARSARRAGDRRLCPARVDGRRPLGGTAPPGHDPDVREPGDRQAAGLVEGADQAAAHPPVRRGRRGRPGPPRLPGPARHAAGPDRPGLQRRRQRLFRRVRPTVARPARRPPGLARRPLFPDRLPVRAREEPRAPGRGVRPLPAECGRATGRGTWSSAATGRDGTRSKRRSRPAGSADAIHRPGFLQVDELPRWYAHAGASSCRA